jgi:hypothetical protein
MEDNMGNIDTYYVNALLADLTCVKKLKNITKTLTILFVILNLSSCDMPGESELEALCKKESKREIYKRVDADGYFNKISICSTCWIELSNYNSKYIEFEIKEEGFVQSSYDKIYNEPGYWRVSREEKLSKECNEYFDKKMKSRIGDVTAKEFVKKYCLKVEKIDVLSSRFSVETQQSTFVLDNRQKSTISKSITYVKDLENGEILAQDINFFLNARPHSWPGTTSCYSLGLREKPDKNLLQEFLTK